jgi:hypothetical protein
MDPDVVVTIAFVGYAVLVATGIGVALLLTRGRQDPCTDGDAAQK